MRRRSFLWTMSATAIGTAWSATGASQQVFDLFTKIAAALSDDDVGTFLDAVDPAMPDKADLRRDLVALIALADVTNSLEIITDTGDDTHRTEEIDWFLEIVNKSQSHTVERRRQVVKFQMERKGKKWKILSMEPLHFFAPPKE